MKQYLSLYIIRSWKDFRIFYLKHAIKDKAKLIYVESLRTAILTLPNKCRDWSYVPICYLEYTVFIKKIPILAVKLKQWAYINSISFIACVSSISKYRNGGKFCSSWLVKK